MKKILVGSVIALAAFAASALEVGVNVGHNFGDSSRNLMGVTVGQTLGPLNVALGFNRSTVGSNDQNIYSVRTGMTVAKLGPVAVSPNVALQYMTVANSSNGVSLTTGVDLSMPIVKNFEGFVDVGYQFGQKRVEQFDGVVMTTGVRYRF